MATPSETVLAEAQLRQDELVANLEEKVRAQHEWIEELRAKVREWEELERWRQAHWNELKTELHTLRAENSELRARLASTHQ